MKRGSETADGIPAWTETTTTSTTTKIVGVPIMEPNHKKLKTNNHNYNNDNTNNNNNIINNNSLTIASHNNTNSSSFKSRFDVGPQGAIVKKLKLPPPYELSETQKLTLSKSSFLPLPTNGDTTEYVNNLLQGRNNIGMQNIGVKIASSRRTNNVSAPPEKDSRTVYVGNIPKVTDEQHLSTFIQNVLTRVLEDANVPDSNNAVVRTDVHSGRQFAFIECKNPTLATSLIHLDTIVYQDVRLRIHRPQSYRKWNLTAPPLGFKLKTKGLAGICPSVAVSSDAGVPQILQTSPYKVFIGALPYNVLEPQLVELLESFGELAALHLVRAPGVLHRSKGYAFCVWKNAEQVTDPAINALNGLEIQGKQLVVKYSTATARGSTSANNNSSSPNEKGNDNSNNLKNSPSQNMTIVETNRNIDVNAALKAAGVMTTSSDVNNSIIDNANDVNSNNNNNILEPVCNVPTNVIMLKNMVEEEELKDDEEYDDIKEDIQEECAKFGEIVSFQMPRDGEYVCKVFLRYKTMESARLAKDALNGRKFGPNVVAATFFVLNAYEKLFGT